MVLILSFKEFHCEDVSGDASSIMSVNQPDPSSMKFLSSPASRLAHPCHRTHECRQESCLPFLSAACWCARLLVLTFELTNGDTLLLTQLDISFTLGICEDLDLVIGGLFLGA